MDPSAKNTGRVKDPRNQKEKVSKGRWFSINVMKMSRVISTMGLTPRLLLTFTRGKLQKNDDTD